MLNRSRRILGLRAAAASSLLLMCTLVAACNYGFRGGGGFPSSIRSINIQAFDNQTAQFELESQILNRLRERLPRALGVRMGSEETADALVRGRITAYSDAAQSSRPSGASQTGVEVVLNQVQITVTVELVNRLNNTVLWEGSVTGRGEYNPTSQLERVAWEQAINHLSQLIIDGAQSQW